MYRISKHVHTENNTVSQKVVLKFENGYVLLEDNKCSCNAIEQRIY